MPLITLPRLAIGSVVILISVLAYGSQVLFIYLEPGPLDGRERTIFNCLVAGIWISYARACLVNPGSFLQSRTGQESTVKGDEEIDVRWCKKCDAYKPPRSHHCKVCKRCIPKMDHHCPWTANCVSHTTFPHFMRFLFFVVASMCQLAGHQFSRVKIIWDARYLPSYLGPSATQLALLLVLCILNALTLFAVGVIFLRTVYCLATNVTAIESWEIERHETLVRRARKHGGVLDGPDGTAIRIVKQEFPYDIGIWSNLCQGMNGGPWSWFWPLAPSPSVESGMHFEENGFERPGTQWPPPDPDRMHRVRRPVRVSDVAVELDENQSNQERMRAFRERQAADFRRRTTSMKTWKNSEGEALEDFGVDEDSEAMEDGDDHMTEDGDEDDLPLGELIARRRRNQ